MTPAAETTAASDASTFWQRLLHATTLLGYSLFHCQFLLVLVVTCFASIEWTVPNEHDVPILNRRRFLTNCASAFYASLALVPIGLCGQFECMPMCDRMHECKSDCVEFKPCSFAAIDGVGGNCEGSGGVRATPGHHKGAEQQGP